MSARRSSALLVALSLAALGAGSCALLAPFPDVAPDRSEGGTAGEGGAGNPDIVERCTPFATRPCYTGPGGTDGVGVCATGVATCNAEGTGFGDCSGEVVPAFESCETSADENCDGRGCTGDYLQSATYGGAGEQRGAFLAVGPSTVVLTGSASGALDLGDAASEELGGASDPDAFVAVFSSAQRLRWSHRFADSVSRGVALTATGDVLIAGGATGDVDFGGGTLTGRGNGEDVFLARFDSAGAHRWSRRFGNGANQFANAVAVDAAGNAVIAGAFWGKLDFGRREGEDEGTALESLGESDAFVAKFDADGALVWAKRFGDGQQHQAATGVAIDRAGDVILVGWFGGSIDFGGGEHRSRAMSDMFVAKLSAAGDHLWSNATSSTNAARALGVAVDGADNIVVAGSFRSSMRFGETTHSNEGDKDAFVLKLDDNGVPLWSEQLGDGADQEANGVAVDPAGDVVVTGFFFGLLDTGVGAFSATGGADGFIAKLDPGGAPLWARAFGDSSEQSGTSVATDIYGDTWATGYFSGAAAFGGAAIASRGASDAFLVQLGP